MLMITTGTIVMLLFGMPHLIITLIIFGVVKALRNRRAIGE